MNVVASMHDESFGRYLLLRKILSDDGELKALPTVLAERCVHTQLMQASCRSCVDVCPVKAWVMDDEALGHCPNRAVAHA